MVSRCNVSEVIKEDIITCFQRPRQATTEFYFNSKKHLLELKFHSLHESFTQSFLN